MLPSETVNDKLSESQPLIASNSKSANNFMSSQDNNNQPLSGLPQPPTWNDESNEFEGTINEGSTNPNPDRIIYSKILFNHEYRITLHQLQYLTFVTIGLALLWPWNCFLSASEYYSSRFTKMKAAKYAKIYSSTMMSVSTVSQLIYNYYLSQRQIHANYHKRFISGQVVNSIIFLLMAASCVWFLNISPGIFFFFLMFLILSSSLSTCSSQNGSMAIVNVFGPMYAQGLMVGQAIAGVLPSIALIVSIIIVGDKPKDLNVEKNYGVMTYYLTSTLVSCFALLLFLAFIYKYAFGEPNDEEAVKHHRQHNHHYIQLVDESGIAAAEGPDDEDDQNQDYNTPGAVSAANAAANADPHAANDPFVNNDNVDDDESKHVPFMYLWIKLKFIVITLVLVFVVSLIFPVFASNIESVNKPTISAATAGDQEVSIEKVHFSNSNIFIPVAFMMWNIGDLAGRIACGYSFFQMTNEKAMFLYSVGRVIFLPLLFMCNLDDYASALQNHSHQAIKPLVNSDVIYLFIQFLYGATNGHLCSNCFMNVGPKFTKDSEKKAAGGFTTVFLSIGLAIGSVASYLFVALIDY